MIIFLTILAIIGCLSAFIFFYFFLIVGRLYLVEKYRADVATEQLNMKYNPFDASQWPKPNA